MKRPPAPDDEFITPARFHSARQLSRVLLGTLVLIVVCYVIASVAMVQELRLLAEAQRTTGQFGINGPWGTSIRFWGGLFTFTMVFLIVITFVSYLLSAVFMLRSTYNLYCFEKPPPVAVAAVMVFLGLPPVINLFGSVVTIPILYHRSKLKTQNSVGPVLWILCRSLLFSACFVLVVVRMMEDSHALVYFPEAEEVAWRRGITTLFFIGIAYSWSSLVFQIARLQEGKYEKQCMTGVRCCSTCGDPLPPSETECPTCGTAVLPDQLDTQ